MSDETEHLYDSFYIVWRVLQQWMLQELVKKENLLCQLSWMYSYSHLGFGGFVPICVFGTNEISG